jgi:hypothetical protein
MTILCDREPCFRRAGWDRLEVGPCTPMTVRLKKPTWLHVRQEGVCSSSSVTEGTIVLDQKCLTD